MITLYDYTLYQLLAVVSCVAGYSAAALLAILLAIPFSARLTIYKDAGRWSSLPQALYHEHLELFLGNACLGNLQFPSHCYWQSLG
jgi:hypothetical protein